MGKLFLAPDERRGFMGELKETEVQGLRGVDPVYYVDSLTPSEGLDLSYYLQSEIAEDDEWQIEQWLPWEVD